MKKSRVLKVFSSFQEADKADRAFYAHLPPQQRLDILIDLMAQHRESLGETAKRFERVYSVVEFPRG